MTGEKIQRLQQLDRLVRLNCDVSATELNSTVKYKIIRNLMKQSLENIIL